MAEAVNPGFVHWKPWIKHRKKYQHDHWPPQSSPQPPQDHPPEARALSAKALPASPQPESSSFSTRDDHTELIKPALAAPACPGSRLTPGEQQTGHPQPRWAAELLRAGVGASRERGGSLSESTHAADTLLNRSQLPSPAPVSLLAISWEGGQGWRPPKPPSPPQQTVNLG